jgi:hypothetical protein
MFILIALIMLQISITTTVAQGEKIRWDIISVTADADGKVVVDVGAPAYARGYDSSIIMLKGSGTFDTGDASAVEGGGEWMTWDYDENMTGEGTFAVTGFVSYAEDAGVLPAEFVVDKIGANEDIRAGLVVLTVDYIKKDGTSAGSGIFVLSCRLINSPASMIEGIAATMGVVSYTNTVSPAPGLDAGHTLFHVVK